MLYELFSALLETLCMVFVAGLLTTVIGLPLGAILFITRPGQFWEHKLFYRTLSLVVNCSRSVPYIVFMIAIIPLTRLLIGTSQGLYAAIVPLTLAAVPFFARITENAFSEVSPGLIEAAQSLGATHRQIVTKVLLPEALPAVIQNITVTLIHLIGYSAMAGAIGGGGLGSLAIHKGYYAFQTQYILATVAILIALVQLIQMGGDYIAYGSCKRD